VELRDLVRGKAGGCGCATTQSLSCGDRQLPAAPQNMRAIEERVRLNRHLALQCSQCDVVTIHCPLHDGTKGLFNKELIGKMKKGAYLVRPAICLPCVCLSFPFSSFPAHYLRNCSCPPSCQSLLCSSPQECRETRIHLQASTTHRRLLRHAKSTARVELSATRRRSGRWVQSTLANHPKP